MRSKWEANFKMDTFFEEILFWGHIVQRILNDTLTIVMAHLAFTEHREWSGQSSNGNFLSIIDLPAQYDHVLKAFLQLPKGTVRYLSATMQNEIIYIVAKYVGNWIEFEIKTLQFYSIIMDIKFKVY